MLRTFWRWLMERRFAHTTDMGDHGEAITRRVLERLGWRAVGPFGLHRGVDGLFVKTGWLTGRVRQVRIVESKVNAARLAPDQMSEAWIRRSLRDMAEHPRATPRERRILRETLALLDRRPGHVRRELWTHDIRGGRTVTVLVALDRQGGPVGPERSGSPD